MTPFNKPVSRIAVLSQKETGPRREEIFTERGAAQIYANICKKQGADVEIVDCTLAPSLSLEGK